MPLVNRPLNGEENIATAVFRFRGNNCKLVITGFYLSKGECDHNNCSTGNPSVDWNDVLSQNYQRVLSWEIQTACNSYISCLPSLISFAMVFGWCKPSANHMWGVYKITALFLKVVSGPGLFPVAQSSKLSSQMQRKPKLSTSWKSQHSQITEFGRGSNFSSLGGAVTCPLSFLITF